MKRIAVLLLLEACTTRDPGPIGDCDQPSGTFAITGPSVASTGSCDGGDAFANGTVTVQRAADGGYLVSISGTTPGTNMPPCPAKLFACELTGACSPDDGGTTQSFDLDISNTRVQGNLTAKLDGGCGFTVPVSGDHR